ncbi:CBS domain-containing protein [Sphingobacterium sp. SRCM116780]|uniref:CBS domain-containing protein n=1 Tax=Sphingobacterium sp. SRCM116780 TaxID=2907623 RepID=UPI001F274172|nr:CBS domain-containing protein [Sphingobacterium sp. SRCM116780]UIR56669.1 CBS domain-containing protein [Sphingobacterium sp. SRCM116780]
MYIANIPLSQNTTIKQTDTIAFALDRMEDFQFHLLPIVDGANYLGYITQNDLLNALDDQFTIATIHLRTDPIYIKANQHPYDAIRLMTAYHIDILPVLDENNTFMGMLTSLELLKAISILQSMNEIGAVVVLEIGIHDFSLSKISHLVEAENCQILNCATQAIPEKSSLEVTLKVNKSNIASLLSSFARQNYNVIETFNTLQEFDDLEDRYQQLMNYINI